MMVYNLMFMIPLVLRALSVFEIDINYKQIETILDSIVCFTNIYMYIYVYIHNIYKHIKERHLCLRKNAASFIGIIWSPNVQYFSLATDSSQYLHGGGCQTGLPRISTFNINLFAKANTQRSHLASLPTFDSSYDVPDFWEQHFSSTGTR